MSRAGLHSMLTHDTACSSSVWMQRSAQRERFSPSPIPSQRAAFAASAESHGWMSVRFQATPRGRNSIEIIIHVRMLSIRTTFSSRRPLALSGLNLIYGAFFLTRNPEGLVGSLLDDLAPGRIEIDMIRATPGRTFARRRSTGIMAPAARHPESHQGRAVPRRRGNRQRGRRAL